MSTIPPSGFCVRADLNRRPKVFQTSTLTTELLTRFLLSSMKILLKKTKAGSSKTDVLCAVSGHKVLKKLGSWKKDLLINSNYSFISLRVNDIKWSLKRKTIPSVRISRVLFLFVFYLVLMGKAR